MCVYFRGRTRDHAKDERDSDQDPSDEEISFDIVVNAIVDDRTEGGPADQTAYATRVGLLVEESVAEPIAEQLGQVAVEPLAVLADSIIPGVDEFQK